MCRKKPRLRSDFKLVSVVDQLASPTGRRLGSRLSNRIQTGAAPVLDGEFGIGECVPEFLRGGGDEGDIDEFGCGGHREYFSR